MITKKLLSIFAATIMFGSVMALDHGSMSVKNSQLYAQIDDASGADVSSPIAGLTVDAKLVTIGTTTWAWTELHGDYSLQNQTWSSQLRWWTPAKNGNSLTGRVVNTQQSFGTINSLPAQNPTTFSIFQHDTEGDWVFRETAKINYDYTTQNSKNVLDNTAPVLTEPIINNQSAFNLELTLSGSDDSNDYFYYIIDENNDYEEVSFINNITIALEPETDYNFTIYAIDFSGNMSSAKTVSITGKKFECNNLLVNKSLALGDVYFAPNWTPSTNYTATVTNNILTAHLGDGTLGQWQAQFPVTINTPLTMIPGNRYSLLVDMSVSNNASFYAKFMDIDDNTFLEIPVQIAYTGDNSFASYDLVCPSTLTKISKILFDFGNSQANIDLSISGISVCGSNTTGIYETNTNKISFTQSDNLISIISDNAIKEVKLHSITGQSIVVNFKNNQINTTNLSNGIYILSIADVLGNKDNYKVIIK